MTGLLSSCPAECLPMTDAVEKVSFLLIASDWRGIEIGESLGGGSGLIVPWISGNRRARERDGWTKGSKRQGLQVLYDGREKKFVAGTGQSAEPHAFETMVGLEVSKAISTRLRSSRDLRKRF